jgi:hypothetical protein
LDDSNIVQLHLQLNDEHNASAIRHQEEQQTQLLSQWPITKKEFLEYKQDSVEKFIKIAVGRKKIDIGELVRHLMNEDLSDEKFRDNI